MNMEKLLMVAWAFSLLLICTYAAFGLIGAFIYLDIDYFLITNWHPVARLAFGVCVAWHLYWLAKGLKAKGWL